MTAVCAACALVRQGADGAAEQSSPTFVEEVPQRARRLAQLGPEQRGVQARRTLELSKRDVRSSCSKRDMCHNDSKQDVEAWNRN